MATTKGNLKRIREILSGNVKGKLNVSVGYIKDTVEHKEGDVWEEDGRMWTIKNGIRKNISKLKAVRQLINPPVICPTCSTAMNHKLDKKFWLLRGSCFMCCIKDDTQKMHAGKFEEYEKNVIYNNKVSYMNDLEKFLEDYIDKFDSRHIVTEGGDVEEWKSTATKEEMKAKLMEYFNEAKKKMEEQYKDSEVKE